MFAFEFNYSSIDLYPSPAVIYSFYSLLDGFQAILLSRKELLGELMISLLNISCLMQKMPWRNPNPSGMYVCMPSSGFYWIGIVPAWEFCWLITDILTAGRGKILLINFMGDPHKLVLSITLLMRLGPSYCMLVFLLGKTCLP